MPDQRTRPPDPPSPGPRPPRTETRHRRRDRRGAAPEPPATTEGHRDLSRNWVGAGHLKIGDQIKQADGTIGLVANVTTLGQTREMFNLTVSEAHTYYIGQDGWLVHNQQIQINHANGKTAEVKAANDLKAAGYQIIAGDSADGMG
ncbi:hypothetical protein IHN32_11070 [Deinococcus sp. 14RED07]|nr:hypothetical protein [Deinococcus sp. 14RED07]